MKNFQDVIRDVYNEPAHALQTTGSAAATIFAVVNTGAASDSVLNIGFATVAVSTPTLYAVVNTGAAGVGNSIVTVANPNFGINAGVNNIGFATVAVSTPTLYAVVNTGAAGVGNSIVTVANPNVGILGNVTLSDSKGFIGLTSIQGNVNATLQTSTLNVGSVSVLGGVINSNLNAGVNGIGFATVNVVNQPALVASSAFIGLVTVANTIPVTFAGNVTITDGKTYIGLTTSTIGSMPSVLASGQYFPSPQSVVSGALSPFSVDATGRQLLGDPKRYIGLASVSGVVGLGTGTLNIGSVSILGGKIVNDTSTLNIGSVSVLGGTIGATLAASSAFIGITTAVNASAWPDPKTFVGLVTASNGLAWADPKTYIGLVTVGHTVTVAAHALTASTVNIGSVSVLGGTIVANLNTGTLNIGSVSILGGKIVNDTSTLNIGSVSILGGTLKLAEPNAFIGLVTSVNGAGTQFIGLVTAWTRNAGTSKTLVQLPVGLGNNSLSTIAVPTNAQKINVTQLILNSNVTTEIAIKSGVTYLTGNASLGVTLFPGGGFVMNGSPDSPVWISLPSGAMVIEKRDGGGTVSKIGGSAIYFDE